VLKGLSKACRFVKKKKVLKEINQVNAACVKLGGLGELHLGTFWTRLDSRKNRNGPTVSRSA